MATKVGKNVLVNFKIEDGKEHKAKPVLQKIDAEFLGGRVRTTTGDTYRVVPHVGSFGDKTHDFLAVE